MPEILSAHNLCAIYSADGIRACCLDDTLAIALAFALIPTATHAASTFITPDKYTRITCRSDLRGEILTAEAGAGTPLKTAMIHFFEDPVPATSRPLPKLNEGVQH